MSCKSRRASRNRLFQRKALALAIGGTVAFGFAGGAFAQATTGTIYGTVPVAANETIQITGGAGYNRTISVGPSGRYSVTLPVGTYTVSLLQNGQVVQTRTSVSPAAAGAVVVDFSSASAANAQTLSTVNVTANAIPAIDVTTTNQVTTITAKQLQQLPIQRSVENIAMLAPGVAAGANLLGTGPTNAPLLIFGGASIAENAYYIDGFNSTDALTGQGGIALPYFSLEQVQTITTGYGAKYGRSVGGVINQIGKSGSNEWHFGLRGSWAPASLQSDYRNAYFTNPRVSEADDPGQAAGDIYRYRKADSSMETIYDAYVSGPIVPDKLFFYVSAEQDTVKGHSTGSTGSPYRDSYTQHYPKLYAKLNWNINDNNILTLTGVQSTFKDWRSEYNFDYDTDQVGDFDHLDPTLKNVFRVGVLNYTSYLTDNLTLNAMYGKMHGEYFQTLFPFPGFDPSLPHIAGGSNQNPAFTPNGPITNSQGSRNVGDPAHRDTVANYRVSLDWKWRTHDFSFGIDNITTWDKDDGNIATGPGYEWAYSKVDPDKPIVGSSPSAPPYVGPPNSVPNGSQGYVVDQEIFLTQASVRVQQQAAYVEDNWQVTPTLLLNLGLRDDSFVNYNPAGQPYIRLTKPQWAPRLGFSWDVHGDSTTKVFGNAGRYYLALPAAVALRGAGASTFTHKYFTYTGIDPVTGIPTGLTPIPQNPEAAESANNEYGQPLDPRTVAAQNVKAEYSDNFVLGFQQQFHFLNTNWVFGATGRYQKLGRIVDDWDDTQAICDAAIRQGYSNFAAADGSCDPVAVGFINGATLVNPGTTQDLLVNDPKGGLDKVIVTNADQRFDGPPKRHYYSLDLSLAHEWDGKWFAKFDYVFSRAYGNTEGPVESDIGQGGSSVSITQQWDFWQLMNYSDGLLLNDQKHQFKLYGAYALTPEWMLGANLFIASGHPNTCLGFFGPDESNPFGYGESFHWCGGQPTPRGSTGFTPWTHQLNLNVDYRPNWAQKRLDFNLAVFNVFNEQHALQFDPSYGSTAVPDPMYGVVDNDSGFEPPRFVRFSVSYEW